MGRRLGIYICAGLLGVIMAVGATCCFDILRVNSSAMEPSIPEGSGILINRLSYFYGMPDKADVVAFSCNVYSEDGEGGILVRRIAATEGDTVEIKNGNLYVNGSIYERYEDRGIYLEDMDKITIGNNRVFVLSDSGQAVLDSRDQAVGQLRIDELEGKVLFK